MADKPNPAPVSLPPPIPFKRGNIVQLKSGGPKMTVQVGTYLKAQCQWFDGTSLKTEIFVVDSLNLAGD